MPIYLPGDIQFTDQDDVAPMSWDMPQAILNWGDTYTLVGNDLITGISTYFALDTGGTGFLNNEAATINTGKGRDVITGEGLNYSMYNPTYHGHGIDNRGSIETGDDEDNLRSYGTFYNSGMVSLGDGDDGLYAHCPNSNVPNNDWSLSNYGTIEAGNGDDRITVIGSFNNSGSVSLGHGNDSISISANAYNSETLLNSHTINTGYGDDRITARVMDNHGFINTGNGKDSLIARDFYGSGNVFLGDGEDYLSGFGSGYYEGGNDQDSLELTSGDYTVGISGGIVSFTKSGYYGQTMQTFGFEKLIGGSTTYNFTSLSDGMIIYV